VCNPLLKLTSKTRDWNAGRLKRPFKRPYNARISNYIIGNVSYTFPHPRLFVSRSADDFQRWLVFTRPIVVGRIFYASSIVIFCRRRHRIARYTLNAVLNCVPRESASVTAKCINAQWNLQSSVASPVYIYASALHMQLWIVMPLT